jgi:hypothetical protein
MIAATPSLAAQTLTIHPLRPADLAAAAPPCLSWLWHGYLAPGKVTTLTSPSKTGKTTLASLLFARMANGGQLANLAVAPARVLVVSEEAPSDWDTRCRKLGLGPHLQFVCRPFQGARPTEPQWFGLIDALDALHRRETLDLVMIDPLATLLPGYAETCAPKMLDCLLPLQALANQGPAVWLLHHPAKGKRTDGQSARGTSALTGFADIVMEMSCYRRARSHDRRRRLCAYSRYAETPRHLILELNADATDYAVCTDTLIVPPWPALQDILANASIKLRQQDILERWPSDEDPPERSTLSRWLKRAAERGQICCAGTGVRGDAFRYWLADRQAMLWPGDHASEEEKQAWKDRWAAHACSLLERTEDRIEHRRCDMR